MMRIAPLFLKILYSIGIGLVLFYIVVGPLVLYPKNIAWLGNGYDPSQHYLGWEFFRNSPWYFPIGLNPNYGLGIGSSIALADCIPLMALLLKSWSMLLTTPFQYLGIWVLICFILQAYCAILVLSLITSDKYLQLLGAALLVISPPMLSRIGVHTSLVSHFLILGALYLIFKHASVKQNTQALTSFFQWLGLLSAAALIHFYLFAMVASLWFVSLLQGATHHGYQDWKRTAISFGVTISCLGLVFWQVGYFSLGLEHSAVSGHYGIGRLNLLSLFDSGSWSYILPPIPDVSSYEDRFAYGGRTYESFTYLGLGLIICLCFALWGLRFHAFSLKALVWKLRYLVIILGCLTVFAISNNIAMGPWSISFLLPDSISSLASILRASARMFWPVYYTLVILIFYIIIKSYSRKVAIGILLFGLLIQVVDTSAGWLSMRHHLMQSKSSQWETALVNPLWAAAAKNYKKVVIVPELNFSRGWRDVASYAVKNQLATNAVYLGRVNQDKLRQDNEHYLEQIEKGAYDLDTIYLLDPRVVIKALKHLSSQDVLVSIDRRFVLLPNYKQCKNCALSLEQVTAGSNLLAPQLGVPLAFNDNGFGSILLNSAPWLPPEPWGSWAYGNQSHLHIPLPRDESNSLVITARALVTPTHPTQEIELTVNGQKRADLILTKDNNNHIKIDITKADRAKGFLDIHFQFKNPAKPKDLGMGDDDRLLSLGLVSAIFR